MKLTLHVTLAWEKVAFVGMLDFTCNTSLGKGCVCWNTKQDSWEKTREQKAKILVFLVKIQVAKYTTSTLLLGTVCGITLAMNDFVSW